MEYTIVSRDVTRERLSISLVPLSYLIRFVSVLMPLLMLAFVSQVRGWGLGLRTSSIEGGGFWI